MIQVLPLAPWLAFYGTVNGATFQPVNLSNELLDAMRILKVDVLFTQPDDPYSVLLPNFAKV